VVKSHLIKQNRRVGLSLSVIIIIIKTILFDNHLLFSVIEWDKNNNLQPEPYVMFIFIQCIYNEIAFKMHVNYCLGLSVTLCE